MEGSPCGRAGGSGTRAPAAEGQPEKVLKSLVVRLHANGLLWGLSWTVPLCVED